MSEVKQFLDDSLFILFFFSCLCVHLPAVKNPMLGFFEAKQQVEAVSLGPQVREGEIVFGAAAFKL